MCNTCGMLCGDRAFAVERSGWTDLLCESTDILLSAIYRYSACTLWCSHVYPTDVLTHCYNDDTLFYIYIYIFKNVVWNRCLVMVTRYRLTKLVLHLMWLLKYKRIENLRIYNKIIWCSFIKQIIFWKLLTLALYNIFNNIRRQPVQISTQVHIISI